jgi:hypothetical protein
MGEIISLSQYRKERVRGASQSRSPGKRARYGLAELAQLGADDQRVHHIVEFQNKKLANMDDEPDGI